MALELLRRPGSSRVIIDGVGIAEAGRKIQSDNCWQRNC